MWVLVFVTMVNVSPPKFEFTQYTTTKTMAECSKLLLEFKKQDIDPNASLYCIYSKTKS